MKRYLTKMVLLLAFTAVAISSCSLEYRERRAHRHDGHDNNNGHRPEVHRYNN